jgi:prepilin-type N-terminal cleavage/methylation domain-containing protein
MKKTKNFGFSMVEILLALAIFSILVVSGASTVIQSFSVNRLGDEESFATLFAQEGLDAVRSIKNKGWSGFTSTDCTSGCGLDSSGGSWVYSGANTVRDKYTRVVTVSQVQRDSGGDIVESGGTPDPNTYKVVSSVDWDFTQSRQNNVELVTYISRWEKSVPFMCGAALSATQTTSGTDLNQSSFAALNWNALDLNDTFFSYSSTDPTKLTVNENGDYMVAITIPQYRTDTNSSRSRIESEIRVNGIKVEGSSARPSYIRNSGDHSESSNNFAMLIPDLSANDEIEVYVRGITTVDSGDNVLISGAASLYAEYVSNSETVFSGYSTQTTSGTDLNTSTALALEWTEVREDIGYSHSDTLNPQTITIGDTGYYLVFINIPTYSTSSRANVKASVDIGGSAVPGGQFKQSYIRNTENDQYSSIHWSGVIENTVSNSELQVSVVQEAATGTVTMDTDRAEIFIQKINTTGTYFGFGNDLTTGLDWNSATPGSILWTTDDTLDSDYYSHSISTAQDEISVNAGGDYLLVFNDSLTSSSGRPNPKITIGINGSSLVGAETKSHYIRGSGGHNESSSNLVYFLMDLNEGDIITVDVEREADTDTVDDDDAAILALISKNTCNSPDNATPTPTPLPTATFTPTPIGGPTATPTFTPTPSPLPTATFTPTPTSSPTTCPQYCATVGYSEVGSDCRRNSNWCRIYDEVYESGGDYLCTGGNSADTCCCQP